MPAAPSLSEGRESFSLQQPCLDMDDTPPEKLRVPETRDARLMLPQQQQPLSLRLLPTGARFVAEEHAESSIPDTGFHKWLASTGRRSNLARRRSPERPPSLAISQTTCSRVTRLVAVKTTGLALMSTRRAPEYIVPLAPAALAEVLKVVAPRHLAAVPAGKSAWGAKLQLSTSLEGDAADAVLGPNATNEAKTLAPVHKLLG